MTAALRHLPKQNHFGLWTLRVTPAKQIQSDLGPDYMERASPVERAEKQPLVQYYMRRASPARLQS